MSESRDVMQAVCLKSLHRKVKAVVLFAAKGALPAQGIVRGSTEACDVADIW